MNIEHIKAEKTGYFKAIENEQEMGQMTYRWKDENTFIIDHTEVNPAFRGRGIGEKLVMAGVEFARENGYKIVPMCSYVVALFEKLEDIEDVKA